jgi:hydroxymethylbilane synthase
VSGITERSVHRVGTRGSALARRQTELVIASLLALDPDLTFQIEIIRTLGDESPQTDLSQFEGQGVFVRGIETGLLDGTIDLAVHSFKDMPSQQPEGLVIGAFPTREDARDALVAHDRLRLAELPDGARIGTGSPRRRALLRDARRDLDVQPLRGNVDTRLRRVADGDLDGVIVAAAGLARLGRSTEIAELLDPSTFTPAIGQGILAVEARSGDQRVLDLLARVDDAQARACALAERAVAEVIGAGCQVPIGAFARVEGNRLQLDAFLARDDGTLVRAHDEGPIADARAIGARAGAALTEKQRGADPAALRGAP